jgi:hypothetical protein
MGNVYEKVKGSRNALEKLIGVIPGFSGYQERQTRRKADQIMRQALAEKLTAQRKRLDAAQVDLINSGRFDLIDELGSAVTQLQTFVDRVRFATYGYSGLFDAVKVNEAELEQLYNFDLQMFDYVQRLDEANDHLRDAVASGEGLVETVRVVREICREANATFDQREHLISGSQ